MTTAQVTAWTIRFFQMVANQTAPLRQFEPIHRTQLHFMHFDSLALLGLVFLALVLVLRLTAIMSSCNYHKIFVGTERNMPAKILKKETEKQEQSWQSNKSTS